MLVFNMVYNWLATSLDGVVTGTAYVVSVLFTFLGWIFTDPLAWVEIGRAVLAKAIDVAMWVLPDSVDSHLASFKALVAGPVVSAAARVGMYLLGHFVHPAVVAALVSAHMIAFPLFMTIRMVRWGISLFTGGN